MYPVINQINQNALQPYLQHKITDKQFIQNTIEPIKDFMVRNTKVSTERTFLLASNIPNKDNIKNINDLPLSVVIPAFMVSELSIAFQIIFLLSNNRYGGIRHTACNGHHHDTANRHILTI